MIRENEKRFQEAMAKDFKTASQEVHLRDPSLSGRDRGPEKPAEEWMKPVEGPCPVSSPILATRGSSIENLMASR